ncbi:uncharacterized protein AMSG_11850 [Thecamonas trahens ATCC 50062]|uniref:Uncharacterized protein n=1 Tax=Thecamonas trahens ATCC 50062 TaxID=461836 RepID=A0A0L0D9X3_THETB|nr:hypothetical protein AMSG_11850 [Thecamonas trahens ATCC 50062]KNC49139.1 hypothetical protein AMSG_11850 [Thecamonas trahens ATCC 50062]|eukprot:XP_013758229.1 hypothetical protein AMSG_11850 [Thecamonas trahens ATCC 50062]
MATTAATPQSQMEAFHAELDAQKLLRLRFLLHKTQLYSTFLASKLVAPVVTAMGGAAADEARPRPATETNPTAGPATSKKRTRAQPKRAKGLGGVSRVDSTGKLGKTGKSGESCQSGESSELGESSSSKSVAAVGAAPRLAPPPTFRGSLRGYQEQGLHWLVSLYENGLNGILADEMGLGKTVQTIALLAHLAHHGVPGPFLVVVPLSTLSNWMRELAQFAPGLSVLRHHGEKEERAAAYAKARRSGVDVVVTTYEIAMRDAKILTRAPWKYLVVDEGHRLKNMNCLLLRKLKAFPAANRLLLTGTPLQNSLAELWSLLNFLLPALFDDVDAFEEWFNLDPEAGLNDATRDVLAKLHAILAPFLLRRLKAEVALELPAKSEVLVYAPLSAGQAELYASNGDAPRLRALLQASAASSRAGERKKFTSLNNAFMQLRKVTNHPYLLDYPLTPDGQLHITEELVAASGKMVVFDALMTKMLDILHDYCWLRGHEFRRIDGSVKHDERDAAIADFNAPNSRVHLFLISTRAGGLGINLTSADTVIIFDSDLNPQMDLQAQDRCHRIGQDKPVIVYRLCAADTVEATILERAARKRRLERLVIAQERFKGIRARAAGPRTNGENGDASNTLTATEDDTSTTATSAGDSDADDVESESGPRLEHETLADAIAVLANREAVTSLEVGSHSAYFRVVDD